MKRDTGLKTAYGFLFIGCCIPWVSAPMALTAGILFGIAVGNPWETTTSVWSQRLLQLSVIGLGFGMNLPDLLRTGKDAFLYTAISISFVLTAGYLLGRLLKIPRKVSTLISFGTAICGGSAVAAMAPVIKAEPEETGVALATIFSLNSVALLLFPPVGRYMGMGERAFGLWTALAIHDTSSVVGAAAAYGGIALAVGTTVKLTRALWIMPSALLGTLVFKSDEKIKIPIFILGFLTAAAIKTALPQWGVVWTPLHHTATQLLVVTLFVIGSGLTRNVLCRTGIKPMAQALLLWLIVATVSATAIMMGWIH